MENPKIQRAIISVSDKMGLPAFARGLADAGVEIYSTGGTRRLLEEEGVSVRDVAEYTGFPEMMDGRLKTLHPKIFGGILCRRDRSDDREALERQGIVPFELVVVNLYPFEATIAREGISDAEAIEQIDIGGPSLVRAAAKNHAFTTIVTQAAQYAEVLEQVRGEGCTSLDLRRRLAGEAFARTAAYDQAIADYFVRGDEEFPRRLTLTFERHAELRYGENPHQKAAVYRDPSATGANVVTARQLHGKELSYNNLLDLDSALAIVRMFSRPAAAVIKHNNPCGAAIGATPAEAAKKALDGDPLSAFGSILAFNRPVDAETAEVLAAPGLFIEAIAAPEFSAEAIETLTTRPKWRQNVRLLAVGELAPPAAVRQCRPLEGGLLVQDGDVAPDGEDQWRVVTQKEPSPQEMDELRFAWAMVRHIKSNAIAVCQGQSLCGAGAGQMSRVDAVDIAIAKAGERAGGAVLASDAFFPFPDSIDKAAAARIAAVIQPGGSKNDDDVVAACNRHGIAMIFTGRRHFKH
ncbi:MAG: bifunctional phosphoribosylaminoimidazolecarboxamide formyltransferase/IMP cyclohydrolase [Planctomycetes bacterium]|nr:bifunctional phosphoribosylaminoimidazolecarboxamide formyltransferase/IMP cyclohydrolase [Planctomycetota bacterium]